MQSVFDHLQRIALQLQWCSYYIAALYNWKILFSGTLTALYKERFTSGTLYKWIILLRKRGLNLNGMNYKHIVNDKHPQTQKIKRINRAI